MAIQTSKGWGKKRKRKLVKQQMMSLGNLTSLVYRYNSNSVFGSNRAGKGCRCQLVTTHLPCVLSPLPGVPVDGLVSEMLTIQVTTFTYLTCKWFSRCKTQFVLLQLSLALLCVTSKQVTTPRPGERACASACCQQERRSDKHVATPTTVCS